MFNVVDKKWGTAYKIKEEAFTMAGKTGTCQVDYTSDNVQYISSFVGYFPAEAPSILALFWYTSPINQKGIMEQL